MSYEELMQKLANWIAAVWNKRKENKEKQIILQQSSVDKDHYNLVPITDHSYVLLYFISQEEYPHYMWDINLDRCERFFGIRTFQSFYEEVHHELEWVGSRLKFLI